MNTLRGWSEIYPNGSDFKAHILEIQKFATPRESSLQWAQNLRFLTPFEQANSDRDADWSDDEGLSCHRCRDYPYFNSPNPQQPTVTALRLTQPGEVRGCDHYIAVSYCWRQPKSQNVSDTPDDRAYTIYTRITDTTKDSRPSRAPKTILDRAIAYASFYGIRFIWIDQECIEQDNRLDQEVGIQSMDLVYERSAAPVGILQTFLGSQWQLDTLWSLHENKDLDYDQTKRAIQLLEHISGDPWFSRAWILQESTSAGDCIDLLIRYDSSLSIPEFWETVSGEIELQFEELLRLHRSAAEQLSRHHFGVTAINIGELMQQVGEKLVEHGGDDDELVEYIDEGDKLGIRLEKVIERILLHTPSDYWNTRIPTHRTACNASLASMYLSNCFNSKPMDRLAILANMCQYPIRIDTTMVQENKHSLETCLFVQAILNGDLSFLVGLKKEAWKNLSSTRDGFSWLPPNATNLDPKESEVWIEGIQPFRLIDHLVTTEGLSLLGFLWTIDGMVDVTDLQAKFLPLFEELSRSQTKEWQEFENEMEQWPEMKERGLSVPPFSSMKELVDPSVNLSRWKEEPLFEKLCCEVVWAILQKLVEQGLNMLADAIWQFFRSKFRHFTSSEWESITERYNAEEDGPSTLDEWIEENVELEARALPESCTHALQLHDDVQDLMIVRDTHPFSGRDGHQFMQIMPWFIERVLEKGYFYYGSLAGRGRDGPMATFDVDKPTQVLLPYSKGMDEFGIEWGGRLPAMQTKRIAWVVEEVCPRDTNEVKGGQNEHHGFASKGMVAGMWKLREKEPRRYNLC
jgi:hypothetical protein